MSQIYLIKYSTWFGQVHCPPSGVSQHCIHAIGICHASSVGCLLADNNNTCNGQANATIFDIQRTLHRDIFL